jgi:RES domain-containing protein
MTAVEESAWDIPAAIQSCKILPWSGVVWRSHSARWSADTADGSLKVSGRFNRGLDLYDQRDTWAVLYTSLSQAIALGERVRHTSPDALSHLSGFHISRLQIDLSAVLFACAADGCYEVGVPGLDLETLCGPDYTQTQAFAWHVRQIAEAFLIPSCTAFPEGNLLIFPDRLRPGSQIRVIDHVTPNLSAP